MKIEEPNTPFAYYNEDHDQSMPCPHSPVSTGSHENNNNTPSSIPLLAAHWDTLESKLGEVAAAREKHGDEAHVHMNMSAEDVEAQKKKSANAFANARKKHYNEIEAMKRFRAFHPDEDEDEDEDEEMQG